jgi:hypothetical protein
MEDGRRVVHITGLPTLLCARSLSHYVVRKKKKDMCKLMVMNWCVRCTAFTRKRDHGALQLRDVELLPLAVLTARLQDMPPPGLVQTDAELDVADAAVSCRSDAAIATPKPKPKAVKKRPRRPPSPQSQVDPSSSSDSSAQSSSSSSSSDFSSDDSDSD